VQFPAQIGVFIAEDSELLQERLLAGLRRIEGIFIAGQALTGKSAIEGIRATPVDVLLLDLNMPEGDGFEVLAAFAGDPVRPLIAVMTFDSNPLVHRKCRDLGADLIFDKGDDLQLLVDVLQNLAAGRCTLADFKKTIVHNHPV